MREQIINFISNINLGYTSLIILLFIASLLFLSQKRINTTLKELFIIVYTVISWIGFYYLNDTLNTIFNLKYFSIKLYLVLLIIGNIIMIANINMNFKKSYKLINYLMFVSNIIIFIANIVLILTNRLNLFDIPNIEYITSLININFIIFIIYLNIICLIYIIRRLVVTIKSKLKFKSKEKVILKENNQVVENNNNEDNINLKPVYKKNDMEGFYIDGVDCSIIFDDDNKDNVLKNYYILLDDVNAKLTNGYTIREYTKIKNIINKLNIKDLNNINLDVNKLSKITIDEYNLLKKYLNKKGISI